MTRLSSSLAAKYNNIFEVYVFTSNNLCLEIASVYFVDGRLDSTVA